MGAANVVANALSRIDINAFKSSSVPLHESRDIYFEAIERQQHDCEELTAIMDNPDTYH